MKLTLAVFYSLLAAVTVLVGCGSHDPAATQPTSILPDSTLARGFSSQPLGSVKAYVSEPSLNTVIGYTNLKTGADCMQTTGLKFPTGMATDVNGNLYVANQDTSPGSVTIFGPNCGPTIATVREKWRKARNVAVGPSGVFYIGNLFFSKAPSDPIAVCTMTSCSSKPLLAPSPGIAGFHGIAVDNNSNVYASGQVPSGSTDDIWEWPNGKMPGKLVFDGSSQQIVLNDSLQFNKHGNLIALGYVAPSGPQSLIVFRGCPSACKATVVPSTISGSPAQFTLNKLNTQLFIANESYGTGGTGSLDVYNYSGKNGLTYAYSVTNGITSFAFGAAVIPTPAL
jgi:hypothetical protein